MSRVPGSPRGPWWRNLKFTPAMGVAVAVLVAGFLGAKFFRGMDGAAPGAAGHAVQGTLRVNLNTATQAELESIPGIGAVLARQIIAQRPYASVDDLRKIRGIGEHSLSGLRPYVKVDGETEKLR